MQPVTRPAVLLLLTLVAHAAASAASDTCDSKLGQPCAKTTPQNSVAQALAAEQQEAPEEANLALLQLAAKEPLTVNASVNKSLPATLLQGHAENNETHSEAHNTSLNASQVAALNRAIKALEAAVAKNGQGAKRANYTRGAACNPFPGGSCFFTGECDASRQAECSPAYTCTCPDYSCAENGRCVISATEIASAVQNGVSNVASTVTNICASVPGLAETVAPITSTITGISNTLGGMIGSLTGVDTGDCSSRYISTCFFSSCDEALGYTVGCEYGSCQCKEGFCAVESGGVRTCGVDVTRIVTSVLAS